MLHLFHLGLWLIRTLGWRRALLFLAVPLWLFSLLYWNDLHQLPDAEAKYQDCFILWMIAAALTMPWLYRRIQHYESGKD